MGKDQSFGMTLEAQRERGRAQEGWKCPRAANPTGPRQGFESLLTAGGQSPGEARLSPPPPGDPRTFSSACLQAFLGRHGGSVLGRHGIKMGDSSRTKAMNWENRCSRQRKRDMSCLQSLQNPQKWGCSGCPLVPGQELGARCGCWRGCGLPRPVFTLRLGQPCPTLLHLFIYCTFIFNVLYI